MTSQNDRSRTGAAVGRRQVLAAGVLFAVTPVTMVLAARASPASSGSSDASPGATPGATPDRRAGAATSTAAGGERVDARVEAFDYGFRPSRLRVAVGETIGLHSSGQVRHDFTIVGHRDEAVALPRDGSQVTWVVPDSLAPGTYTFYCSIGAHRAQGMEGTIIVTG